MLGFTGAFLVACQGSAAAPAVEPTAAPTATALPSPTSTPVADSDEAREYRALARETINGFGELTRIISNVGIALAGRPQDAPLAQDTVELVKDSFDLQQQKLTKVEPPPGYEELHTAMLNALSFYTQASAALLPNEESKANFDRFQELMQQGGKNAHSASALIDEIRRNK